MRRCAEFYWGPLIGGGTDAWFAYVIALVFLLFRPQGLFGEKNYRAGMGRTMLYREAGQFKTSYASDQAVFPILQDRIGIFVILAIAYRRHSATGNDFLINAVMIPFLIFALASIGLNLLTGYTGLLSLGTGAFMGVGAYACYKLTTVFPDVNIIIWIIASGFFSAAVGVVFGLPAVRIKGFYLAIATLAAQFFLEWCFTRIPWLYNYNVRPRSRCRSASCSASS